ncbi:MAG TPA: GNAT family N-acetyltransferase, partial [Acidimicrobiales bacterium]|nr:GNAT family N-acetyltransferase [Acidimicrobiales bacterium]
MVELPRGCYQRATAMVTDQAHAIGFRPLRRSDFVTLAQWFREAEVARWWNPDASPEGIEEKYGPRVDGRDPTTTMWIVEVDDNAVGLAQHYRHLDHRAHDEAVEIPGAVGIDYLLSEVVAGRGLGALVLARFADLVLELTPDARTCVATPAQENRRSWRALEKAGFRRHGMCQPPDEPPAFAYRRDR